MLSHGFQQSPPPPSLSPMPSGTGLAAALSFPPPPPPRRSRPCDTCRLRKTRCVREQGQGQGRCVLCSFHNQPCTFLRGPLPRQRRVQQQRVSQGNEQIQPQPQGQGQREGRGSEVIGAAHLSDEGSSNETTSNPTSPASKTADGSDPSPLSSAENDNQRKSSSNLYPDDDNDNNNNNSGHVVPAKRRKTEPSRPAILNNTLGLDLETHAEYIGPTDYRDPVLLDLHRPESRRSLGQSDQESLKPRRCARRLDSRTIFLIHPDESSASEAERIADLDAIEATVHPLGRTLIDLYFRIVHPSFPILHKDVFISKHRVSHRHFAPPLLAAVYLIALDWQIYDSTLAGRESQSIPDPAALEELAERTMAQYMRRPKLSTLEAGLLLLQRSRSIAEHGSNNAKGSTSSRLLTAQMVAMAQDLGIHVDCTSWSIPPWEVGLRRRLAWALYMQDRWGGFIHGRPFLIQDHDWDVQPCVDADYPELTVGEDPNSDGTTTTRVGWDLFLRHIELSHILSDVMRTFYTTAATRSGGTLDSTGVVAAVEQAKPLVLRLREWHTRLPERLHLESTQLRKLCANGALHLAHAAIEIALHRALLRIMTPETPSSLYTAVRSTARGKLEAATELLGSLRPEHTAAFWGSAAAYQVAEIGSLAGLLWATADSTDEIDWCAARMDELRWALRVRGAAAPFAREALRLLERDIGGLGMVTAGGDG